jgi:hypothetical protein
MCQKAIENVGWHHEEIKKYKENVSEIYELVLLHFKKQNQQKEYEEFKSLKHQFECLNTRDSVEINMETLLGKMQIISVKDN